MDTNKEVAWLERVKQYIEDEGKIVTLPYLCKKLELNGQQSSNIMKAFLDKHVNDNYAVTYTIMGILSETDQHCIEIIPAKELSAKKALYKIISYESVYSIQKSKSTDFTAISLVDCFKIHNNYEPNKGCYVSANCVRRTNIKTEKVKPTVSRAPVVDKAKATHMFGNTNGVDKQDIKKEAVEKSTIKPEQIDEKKTQPKPKVIEKQKTSNNLMSMFQKMPSKEKKEEVVKMECDDIEANIPSEGVHTVEDRQQNGTSKDTENVQKVSNGTDKSSSKKQSNKAKKRNRQDASSDRSQKKRKRIIQPQEDSDDDIFVNDELDADPNESVDIIMSDEEDIPKKSTLSLNLKSRSQKFVDKTYTDEEGYIVTSKELVIVSEDEIEVENVENKKPVVVEPKKTPITKKTSPKLVKNGKKQTAKPTNQKTLTDFFTKK